MDTKVRERIRAGKNRTRAAEYKVLTGCTDCGYNTHHAALEFDHLPEFEKSQTVASLMYRTWDVIQTEIDKCEVVCSNCHSIRTYERRQ